MLAHSEASEYTQHRGAALSPCATSAATAAASGAAPSAGPGTIEEGKSFPVPSPLSGADRAASAATTHAEQGHSTSARLADTEIVAIASSSAAVFTKSLLHPLDTLKCRVQLLRTDVLPPHAQCNTWRGLACTRLRQLRHQYTGQWTPKHLYGGLPVKLVFYVPYQALYLSSYNYAQRALQNGKDEAHAVGSQRSPDYLWRTMAAAVFAEIVSCSLRVPMETMKMRVQSAATAGSLNAAVQLWRQGLHSNLRLLIPHTVMHDLPYSIIQWVVYETLRPWTQQWSAKLPSSSSSTAPDGELTSKSFLSRYGAELARTFLSGGFSGLMASALTVPLDNIRTRTVVATASDPKLTVGRVVRVAYRREGLRGFVRGGGIRVLWVTTNMACFYPLFEGIRSILQCRADAGKKWL